ncbi:MAG: P-II family nitrogen regulator [Nitrospiria bacterium]
MKLVQAMVRPEKEEEVISALEKSGFFAYTRLAVSGRGRQRGIRVGSVRYEELKKISLMIACETEEVDRVVDAIKIAARTGNPGDGKIFVSTLKEVRSVRKGETV